MNSELLRRILFTIGALLVFRFGTYVPVPGIDLSLLAQVFHTPSDGILGFADALSGGAAARLGIFALGITQYVVAAVLIQLAGLFIARLRAAPELGEKGRATIRRYTLYVTVALTALQAFGVANGLQEIPGLVTDPGRIFLLTTTLTLVAGTLFLVFLAEQITLRGLGNGISILLLAGLVLGLPGAAADAVTLVRRDVLSMDFVALLLVAVVALTALTVFVERARRHVSVRYSGGRRGALSFKLNNAGLIPPLLASWCLGIPIVLSVIFGGPGATSGALLRQLQHGQPLYMLAYGALIVLFTFVYTAFVHDPDAIAASLKRHGGELGAELDAGLGGELDRRGETSAGAIDYVLSRTTVIGTIYLAFVCLIPEMLISYKNVPFYFGGTAMLIAVCAVTDIEAQVRGWTLLRRRGRTS